MIYKHSAKVQPFGLMGLLILCLVSSAQAQDPRIQSWKTFTSDYGYEFKYPNCWIVEGDSPRDHSIENPSSKDIFISERKACELPKMSNSVPNGFGTSVDRGPLETKTLIEKKIASLEKHVANNITRNEWKIYKRFTANNTGTGYIYVENETNKFHPYIRWHLTLYCPHHKIEFTGPMIDSPDKSFDEKFKAGDLALPEPERTIYESIRCVDSKTKTH